MSEYSIIFLIISLHFIFTDYRTTEKQEKLRNDNVNANEKVKTQDHTDDDCTAKKDLQNQGK